MLRVRRHSLLRTAPRVTWRVIKIAASPQLYPSASPFLLCGLCVNQKLRNASSSLTVTV